MKIGIIDSGIGGKGIEKEIQKLLPEAETVYFADQKNFPYGTKSIDDLNLILKNNVQYLINKGARIIVLACNSASVTSLNYLRKIFPNIPIVGTVPAIKVAADNLSSGKVAIFSTPITAESRIQKDLINSYGKNIEVVSVPFNNLASLIENGDIDKARKEIAEAIIDLKDIDAIVLGCTHYTLIKDEIQEIVGKNIKIYDSNKAVARQVKKICDKF